MGAAAWTAAEPIERPGVVQPGLARAVRRWLAPVVRHAFRPTLAGVEQLPSRGPYLLVANHSAGIGLAEILSLLVLWLRDVGTDRPLAGFALPIGFRVFPLSAALRAIGAVPSTYAAAEATLAAGVPLMVFPGGDHETLRPLWQANRVDFAGRLGFLRIARAAGVPIVPLGIRGGHWTAPMLFRARWLATVLVVPRLLGTKRWGVSLLGALGALLLATALPAGPLIRVTAAWAWLGSPLSFLPWVPWTLRFRIGTPLGPEVLFPRGAPPDDEQLRAALTRVQAAVQALVDP